MQFVLDSEILGCFLVVLWLFHDVFMSPESLQVDKNEK